MQHPRENSVKPPPWLGALLQDGEWVASLFGPSLWLALLRRPKLHIFYWLVAALAWPLDSAWRSAAGALGDGLRLVPFLQEMPLSPAALASGAVCLLAFSLLAGVVSCSCEHYILTNRRLIVLRGVASRRSVQVRLAEVIELHSSSSAVQRLLGLGDVQAQTAASSAGCVLRCVRWPQVACELIERQRIADVRERQQGDAAASIAQRGDA
jgi:hypothetical protein